MNEPSERQVIHDLELLVHQIMDAWLYGKKLHFEAKALPRSVIERIKNEMQEGKLHGFMKEGI